MCQEALVANVRLDTGIEKARLGKQFDKLLLKMKFSNIEDKTNNLNANLVLSGTKFSFQAGKF